jgi:hypothetical protein
MRQAEHCKNILMPKLLDLAGQRFGKLTAVRKAPASSGHVRWECQCDCGRVKTAFALNLRNGATVSCGCQSRKGAPRGRISSPLYVVWRGMLRRCERPHAPDYARYGGRGISVCAEWRSLEKFEEWAFSSGWSPELSIDRIDVNGNYEPGNCRWATALEQASNKRNNRFIDVAGERMTVAAAARATGLKRQTIYERLWAGKSDEEALKPLA